MKTWQFVIILVLGLLPGVDGPAKGVRVVLVGDSTVADAGGWGGAFCKALKPGAVGLNHAKGGRSSRSFIAEGHWARALADKPDYVLIQFGHNDQPGKGADRETLPESTFREFLTRYVDEARAAKATPVLLTPLTRRGFRDGKVIDTLGPYTKAVHAVAEARKVPLIDLNARSMTYVNALGPTESDTLGPQTKGGKPDRTHLNEAGARAMSSLVIDDLRKVEPALARFLPDEPAR